MNMQNKNRPSLAKDSSDTKHINHGDYFSQLLDILTVVWIFVVIAHMFGA